MNIKGPVNLPFCKTKTVREPDFHRALGQSDRFSQASRLFSKLRMAFRAGDMLLSLSLQGTHLLPAGRAFKEYMGAPLLQMGPSFGNGTGNLPFQGQEADILLITLAYVLGKHAKIGPDQQNQSNPI